MEKKAAENTRDSFSTIFTVPTDAPVEVEVRPAQLELLHLGVKDDGVTASEAGDCVIVMEAGADMAANLSSGKGKPMDNATYIATRTRIEAEILAAFSRKDGLMLLAARTEDAEFALVHLIDPTEPATQTDKARKAAIKLLHLQFFGKPDGLKNMARRCAHAEAELMHFREAK